MKRRIALLLVFVLILSGCGNTNNSGNSSSEKTETATQAVSEKVEGEAPEQAESENTQKVSQVSADEDDGDPTPFTYKAEFDSLNNPELMRYVEDNIYQNLVEELDSDEYFVDNVSTAYVSQEYIDELAYNSQSNIYFGYTLAELDEAFQGTRYVFTLGENGETTVIPLEGYDDTYEKAIKNVAVGTGVILVCVTVSAVTAGAGAPAVSMIFAASAKTGTLFALSSGTMSGVAAGAVTGIQTKDMDQALKAAASAGSESFKWGAIIGAVTGGASTASALKGATLNGLSMNEAAAIQKESKYPLEVIKQFHSTKEYEVFKTANLKSQMVNGKLALVRSDFNLDLIDEMGRTNLQRMQQGLAPLDSTGNFYELHHIGQRSDATLAILTKAEHDNPALHGYKAISEIVRPEFTKTRREFWKTMAVLLEKGGI